MGEILGQLQRLFLQSIPTVIFVFLLFVILDRLFFRPLTGILRQREEATVGALARAAEQAAAAEAKAREYEAAFQAAKHEVFRLRETERRAATEERERMLKEARVQSESYMREALAGLTAEVDTAKQELRDASQSLALEIAQTILGKGLSADQKGRLGA